MVTIFTLGLFKEALYLYKFWLKFVFKVVRIYLEKDMSQTIYELTFSILLQGAVKSLFLVQGREKVNEAWGLQKVIGVWHRDEEKVRLYKNCWIANNLCMKNHFMSL